MRLIDADRFLEYMTDKCDMSAELDPIILGVFRGALKEQPTAYDIDKVVRQLNLETVGSSIKETLGLLKAIEIVKQGGVSDDVCEWKLEDEEANLYLTGCQQRQLIFEGTPKENGYRYCHYCGKKILCKE